MHCKTGPQSTGTYIHQSDFPKKFAAVTTMRRKGDLQTQPRPGGGAATVVGVTK